MDILNINNLILFFIFVIPGFISLKVWSLLVPSDQKRISDYIYEMVAYSSLNFVVVFLPLNNLYNSTFAETHPIFFYLIQLFFLLCLPVVWPIGLYNLFNIDFLKGKINHPCPNAWEHFFGKGDPCFVLVHLKNGNLIGGLYANDSYTASFPHKQDIYLTEVWKIDGEGHFIEKVKDTKGIWIDKDFFDYLEFFQISEEENLQKENEEEKI